MMLFYQVLLFIIVCICYVHIWNHVKKNNVLEIYDDIYIQDKRGLLEMTSLKIPFVFIHQQMQPFQPFSVQNLKFTSPIYYRNPEKIILTEPLLRLGEKDDIMEKIQDLSSCFLSERNWELCEKDEFLQTIFATLDNYLHPSLCKYKKFDLLFGSSMSFTPLRYEDYSHTYIHCIHAKEPVKIMLIPYNRIEEKERVQDLLYYEFRTTKTNPWRENGELEEGKDFLIISLQPGSFFSLPNFWYYSIQLQSSDDVVCMLRYMTHTSMLAVLPTWGLHQIQKWNIKPNPNLPTPSN